MSQNPRTLENLAPTCAREGCGKTALWAKSQGRYNKTCSPACARQLMSERTKGDTTLDVRDYGVMLFGAWAQASLRAIANGEGIPERIDYQDRLATKNGWMRKWDRNREVVRILRTRDRLDISPIGFEGAVEARRQADLISRLKASNKTEILDA